MSERKVITPGEVIVSGNDYLPGDGTEKRGEDIVALKYGLAEEVNKLIRVIPLSGVYSPRRGNIVIGKVENLLLNGWVIDIGTAEDGFLSITEVPRYVNKNALDEVLNIGDMVVLKIISINKRGIDLTLKQRGLGKIEEGLIVTINPHKVPRVIGREGSMIKMIKEATNCSITVGQNGLVWIKGDKINDEIFAKKAIEFINKKPYLDGLTEAVEKFLKENKNE